MSLEKIRLLQFFSVPGKLILTANCCSLTNFQRYELYKSERKGSVKIAFVNTFLVT